MTAVEARLFIPATPDTPGIEHPIYFPDDPPGVQTRIDPFNFLSVAHLPGTDIVRIQEFDERPNKGASHQLIDLPPGARVRVYAPRDRHAFIEIHHLLASETPDTL